MLVCIPFFAAFFFFGKSMIGLFLDSAQAQSTIAVDTGVQFLQIVSPFYFIIVVKLMADSVLRGASAMVPFMVTTFADLVLRVVLAFALSPAFHTTGIWASWPIGWVAASVMSVAFYLAGLWNPQKRRKEKAY